MTLGLTRSLERLSFNRWIVGSLGAVSVHTIDREKIRQRERRQPRSHSERTPESKPLNEPADRSRAGADAGVEGREDRAECCASPLRGHAAHHVADVIRIGGAESEAEDQCRRQHPESRATGSKARQAEADHDQAGYEHPLVTNPIAQ